MKMAEDSKHKTPFTCHLRLCQYRRMPFGLTNALATFHWLMMILFSGQEWNYIIMCLYYIDDILIAFKSMSEQREHVQKVLQWLKQSELKLKPSKCSFATTEIEYLGHTLTSVEVRPNDSKVTAVKEYPRPQTVKQVKSFFGLVNFYRRHIPNMAAISRQLTNLSQKENIHKFIWTSECTVGFEEIKRHLVTALLLHLPDMEKEFFLWTDASEKGFDAVLEQEGTEGK